MQENTQQRLLMPMYNQIGICWQNKFYSVTGNLEWNIFFSVQIISMWLMIKKGNISKFIKKLQENVSNIKFYISFK